MSAPTGPPEAPLRPPGEVMRLSRLGASFPTRLSFARQLVRRLAAERREVRRTLWEIDAAGHGRAVLTLQFAGHTYSLVAFSRPLSDAARTDRVIAEAWDTAYVLTDGVPDGPSLARLEAAVPRQEAGRFTAGELILSRANRSVRLFSHVAARLADGRQPDAALVRDTGYLMRTTAVYGNGKFGIADRGRIADRPGLGGPFAAEMLTVWLIRGFTLALVEHVAAAQSPGRAVRLAPALRRFLGIGNSTGLGMAPFLVTHPLLIDRWITARERALARVRAVPAASAETRDRMQALLARAAAHLAEWRTDDPRQADRSAVCRRELRAVRQRVDGLLAGAAPWEALYAAASECSDETCELLVSLMIEVHGPLVDDLGDAMAACDGLALDAAMPAGALAARLARDYGWALETDFGTPEAAARFWYVSEEKAEPRLGERAHEPGAAREMPLDIARQAARLAMDLGRAPAQEPLALFLARHPEHRSVVRRVQAAGSAPYAEVRDNLIGADCLPIDLLRAKLAVFGATKFDPRSDRWVRIALFQGAPTFEDIADGPDAAALDDWAVPTLADTPAHAPV